LPVLKAGHFLKIGTDFYQILTVRRNRQRHEVSGAITEAKALNVSENAAYEPLHGNLKKDRVVHLQYVAVETAAVTSVLYWGTVPLLSKDYAISISTVTAPVDAPLEIDRWSFDESMRLALTQSATQIYDFECVEYEVTKYEGVPKMYLHIMANGQAIFVERA
jgi:hypothetical protein